MASFEKLTDRPKYMRAPAKPPKDLDIDAPGEKDDAEEEAAEGEQVADADTFAAERTKRAAKYAAKGAGVNQGDQRAEAADALDAEAKRRQRQRGSFKPNAEELDIRGQAKRMRGKD